MADEKSVDVVFVQKLVPVPAVTVLCLVGSLQTVQSGSWDVDASGREKIEAQQIIGDIQRKNSWKNINNLPVNDQVHTDTTLNLNNMRLRNYSRI